MRKLATKRDVAAVVGEYCAWLGEQPLSSRTREAISRRGVAFTAEA